MNHPMVLLETVRAFMKSRIVLTAVELDLFTIIGRGVDTAKEIAETAQLDQRALTRLLDAVVTFDLLTKKDGRYTLTPEGKWLSADQPETPKPMILHMNELWDTWSHLTTTVRMGVNPERTPVSEKDHHALKAFIGAMHVVGKHLSREIAEDLDLSHYAKLLDIGGASGTYTIAFLKKNPDMHAVIFDLHAVLPVAEERLAEAGMQDRVRLCGGDFYKDDLPGGCDLALLSAIIHQNSPDQNLDLFRKIYTALEPGGTLIIRDHIMNNDRIYPPAGAVFAVNMLVGTDGGDTYTLQEVENDLKAAGFANIRQIRKGEKMDSIITAEKPGQ